MKVTKLILLLSLLPFVLTTCKDDEPQYLGEFRLGAEGEAYIKFEPGSYWVYENDMTGERDSIVMDYYRSEMRPFQGLERNYSREHIEFKWSINETGSYTHITGHPFVDLTPENVWQNSVMNWGFITTPEAASASTIVFMPIAESGAGGAVGGTGMHLSEMYDSLNVSNEWYYEVAVFEVDRDWIWDSKPTKYYWAKNVGLIKKEKFKHWTNEYIEGWHLVKYQVTQ
jgi:hypothetical protein